MPDVRFATRLVASTTYHNYRAIDVIQHRERRIQDLRGVFLVSGDIWLQIRPENRFKSPYTSWNFDVTTICKPDSPHQSPSKIMQYIKGKNSRKLMMEFNMCKNSIGVATSERGATSWRPAAT